MNCLIILIMKIVSVFETRIHDLMELNEKFNIFSQDSLLQPFSFYA